MQDAKTKTFNNENPATYRSWVIGELGETLYALRALRPNLQEARQRLHELKKIDAQSIAGRLEAIKLEVAGQVANETYLDDNGKVKNTYSNDTQRRAEIMARLEKNEEYLELEAQLKEYNENLLEAEMDLRAIQDHHYGLVAEKDIIVAMANLS